VLTVTLDKWLTKLVLAKRGIDTPRAYLITPDEYRRLRDPGTLGLALPLIVKPNYEGSSKGIADDAVVRDARALSEVLPRALRAYPTGVLVEEFVAGTSKMAARTLGIRDVGRIDFRIGEDGRIYLLEVNAVPSLEPGASLFAAAAREGLDYGESLQAVVESAAKRQGLVVKPGARRRRPADPLRIGFTYNVKRV